MIKRTYNFAVELKEGESTDRLIKRFLKKTKKSNITNEYVSKTMFHLTKSQKNRKKRLKNKFLREKFQSQKNRE